MCAEYNVGGGGEAGKGLHKSFAFFFPSGLKVGNYTWIAFEMQWARRCWWLGLQGSQELGFLLEMDENKYVGSLLAVTEHVIWI